MTQIQQPLQEDFPSMNQKGAAKGNAIFYGRRNKKVKQRPNSSPTHDMLWHDVPAAFLFLQQRIQS